uniref:Histone H1 n=1 Tax=Sinocyclocheilus anshuiensis TaxID=1608454 RepID=A0A671SJX0_9TELE
MAETAPAAAAPLAKAPKKKSAAKAKKAGPGVGDLIVKAVSASKERSGVSLAALKKALAAGGYDVEKKNSRIKLAIKSLVTKGTLLQVKGTGASGSFKISKKPQLIQQRCKLQATQLFHIHITHSSRDKIPYKSFCRTQALLISHEMNTEVVKIPSSGPSKYKISLNFSLVLFHKNLKRICSKSNN